MTWIETGAGSFLRDELRILLENDEDGLRRKYGRRFPSRSELWHPLFALFAGGYFLLTCWCLWQGGCLQALSAGFRGLVILSLIWALLWGVHSVLLDWVEGQFPEAHWHTFYQRIPSAKFGVTMAIAANPLPLLCYLVLLWPILPGSQEVLVEKFPADKRRIALCIPVFSGAALVMFHLGMLFLGNWWLPHWMWGEWSVTGGQAGWPVGDLECGGWTALGIAVV